MFQSNFQFVRLETLAFFLKRMEYQATVKDDYSIVVCRLQPW